MNHTAIKPGRRFHGRAVRGLCLSGFCLVNVLLGAGCHEAAAPVEQKSAPAAGAASVVESPPVAGTAVAAPTIATPSVAARSESELRANIAGEVNEFMTGQLAVFIQQNGRLPQNFAEFARTRLDGVPRPPAGMKWAIDSASREVKAVAVKQLEPRGHF